MLRHALVSNHWVKENTLWRTQQERCLLLFQLLDIQPEAWCWYWIMWAEVNPTLQQCVHRAQSQLKVSEMAAARATCCFQDGYCDYLQPSGGRRCVRHHCRAPERPWMGGRSFQLRGQRRWWRHRQGCWSIPDQHRTRSWDDEPVDKQKYYWVTRSLLPVAPFY